MKHILYVAFLSISLPALLAANVEIDGSNRMTADPTGHSGNDNKPCRRGRDDSNRQGRNRNSNSANSNSTDSDRSGSSISSTTARAIALKAVPGTVVKEEYDQKRGRSVYEFYI